MRLALALLLLLGFCRIVTAQTDPNTPAEIGRWTARFPLVGLQLDYDRVPILRGGIVQLFNKDYTRGYYGSGGRPPKASVEPQPDGSLRYRTTYGYEAEPGRFTAEQTALVAPNGIAKISLTCRWEGKEPALLEWIPTRLWAYPLRGGKVEFEKANGDKVASTVPYHPEPKSDALSPRWRALNLQVPKMGALRVEAEDGSDGAAFQDGRNDSYLPNDRLFWIGYAGYRLEPGKTETLTLTFRMTPDSNPTPPTASTSTKEMQIPRSAIRDLVPPLKPLDDAVGNPIIIPQPKRANFTAERFQLRGTIPLTIAFPETPEGQKATKAAQRFAEEMRQQSGVRWQPTNGMWKRRGLLVTMQGAIPLPNPITPALTENPEGYALVVTKDFVAVVGKDAAGAFYGLQTLRQLLRTDKSNRAYFAGADITDWPSLRFRGAHLFVGKNALPFHKRLIERIFSRYKMNAFVIECEYTAWKSQPDIHTPFSMSPEDLRAEVAFARDHFLEPIPLVNSLGHCEWIFKNGKNLDIAEDVNRPYAYDVSNPRSYEFIFSVYAEALDIFKPRWFHIGHDEVKVPGTDQFGKYPARPQNIEKGTTRLFLDDTNRLAAWLRERGVRTMLWGDMLLHPSEGDPNGWRSLSAAHAATLEEAKARRAGLPKEIAIADWRYEAGSEQRNGLEIFQKMGAEAIGSAWYEPRNIRGWAHQAIGQQAWGTLQTTWAGYDSNIERLEEEYRQFTAFVLAAEYAWSGNPKLPQLEPDPQNRFGYLPYTASDVFSRSFEADAAKARGGWILNVGAVSNAVWNKGRLSPTGKNTPQQLVAITEAPGIRLDMQRLAGILFAGRLTPAEFDPSALPQSLMVPIKAKAGELRFVHATLVGVERNTLVASYTVSYGDGTKQVIPIRAGREIRALDDASPATAYSTAALTGKTAQEGTLRIFRWKNPKSHVPIASIEFKAENGLASPILFAVSGIAP